MQFQLPPYLPIAAQHKELRAEGASSLKSMWAHKYRLYAKKRGNSPLISEAVHRHHWLLLRAVVCLMRTWSWHA